MSDTPKFEVIDRRKMKKEEAQDNASLSFRPRTSPRAREKVCGTAIGGNGKCQGA